MVKIDDNTKKALIQLAEDRSIFLEGNILKVLDISDDPDFEHYVKNASERDKEIRRKRLDITKQIQNQNRELLETQNANESLMSEIKDALAQAEESKAQMEQQNTELMASKEENVRMNEELKEALDAAESAKLHAESDLDLLQKKTQFQLINLIVKVALIVIAGVGITTTALYLAAMFTNKDTQIIGSTWSNMFGILLTNAFSIIGTIMGVKYASEKSSE
jgi:flagellar biosynthesis GTPase FlhF